MVAMLTFLLVVDRGRAQVLPAEGRTGYVVSDFDLGPEKDDIVRLLLETGGYGSGAYGSNYDSNSHYHYDEHGNIIWHTHLEPHLMNGEVQPAESTVHVHGAGIQSMGVMGATWDTEDQGSNQGEQVYTTDTDAESSGSCLLEDGEEVEANWSGPGAGGNYCNTCICVQSTLTCTMKDCEQDVGDNFCVLTDGTKVPDGWSGHDAGDNYCNTCGCSDTALGCTRKACGPDCRQDSCPEDKFLCEDETFVSRDPCNDCEFGECPVDNNLGQSEEDFPLLVYAGVGVSGLAIGLAFAYACYCKRAVKADKVELKNYANHLVTAYGATAKQAPAKSTPAPATATSSYHAQPVYPSVTMTGANRLGRGH